MSLRPAIASLSLGRAFAGHSLEAKLTAAAKAGFQGIECFYEDIEVLATSYANQSLSNESATATDDNQNDGHATKDDGKPAVPSDEHILAAAKHFKFLATQYNLSIICLQPFMHYEGLLRPTAKQSRLAKLQLWFQLARILGTDIIQVPSNFLPSSEITGDHDVIVADLRELADLGAKEKPVVRFAYENICWGAHVSTWWDLWRVVKDVDRENFGMCVDTFHLCGSEFADPGVESGRIGDGGEEEARRDFEESMREMVSTVDVSKVWYVQLSDAEKCVPPMREGGSRFFVEGQRSRMSWSRNLRTFPFEPEGTANAGYLPVDVAARALLEEKPKGLGFKGWVSMEVFSWTLAEKKEGVPEEHARRGWKSWEATKKLLKM